MNKNLALILDGYNLFYRARYSRTNLGEYSTIFNFFRAFRSVINKFNPDDVYVVLEGVPKQRLALQSDYKANRDYKDDKDNFKFQRKEIIRLLNYFPVNIVKHEDFECDDIIGYLSSNLNHKEKIIVSSDTDFIQCISENVKLFNFLKQEFREKPDYDYIVWKSLRGDKADNIKGFKGIGDKKAEKLCLNEEKLNEFLLIENNKEVFEKNYKMIKLHELTKQQIDNIIFKNKSLNVNDLNYVKSSFIEYNFNSIIGDDIKWKKFTKPFDKFYETRED